MEILLQHRIQLPQGRHECLRIQQPNAAALRIMFPNCCGQRSPIWIQRLPLTIFVRCDVNVFGELDDIVAQHCIDGFGRNIQVLVIVGRLAIDAQHFLLPIIVHELLQCDRLYQLLEHLFTDGNAIAAQSIKLWSSHRIRRSWIILEN